MPTSASSTVRRVGRLICGLGVATIIFFAVGELLARGTKLVDRMNGYTRDLYRQGPSGDLPYRLRPGVQLVMRGIPVRVNSVGMRGPDVARTPAPGVHRVLVLGDSVVFGQEMAEADTLPARLARDLEEGGGRWEVLNAGVPGYDAVASAQAYDAIWADYAPQIVIFGMSLNDYGLAPGYSPIGVLTNRDRDEPPPGWVDRWVDRSEFVTLLRWLREWGRGTLTSQLVQRAEAQRDGALPPGDPGPGFRKPALVKPMADLHLAFYHAPIPWYWDRMIGAIADLARSTSRHGARLLVVIFPESYQVGVPAPDDEPQRRILAACAEHGVSCLDLLPAFARVEGESFFDVSHPNARGHAAAAMAIAEALRAPAVRTAE